MVSTRMAREHNFGLILLTLLKECKNLEEYSEISIPSSTKRIKIRRNEVLDSALTDFAHCIDTRELQEFNNQGALCS